MRARVPLLLATLVLPTLLAVASAQPDQEQVGAVPVDLAGQRYVLASDRVATVEGGRIVLRPGEPTDPPAGALPVFVPEGEAPTAANARLGTSRIVFRPSGPVDVAPQGLTEVEPVEGAPGYFVGRVAEAWEAPSVAARMRASATIEEAYAELGVVPRPALLLDDVLVGEQWHLGNDGRFGGLPGIDLNTSWTLARGAGVGVSVVDDGLETTHPDLAAGYVANGSRDLCAGADGVPAGSHGTSVAGIVGARAGNGIGVAGVAPESAILAKRIIGCAVGDATLAEAASVPRGFSIVTNSWGFGDDTLVPLWPATRAAIENATSGGRDGRGVVYLWAAGNSRASHQDANYHGFTASRHVITVGAIDDLGRAAWYSTPCACILVAAPTNGGQRGVATTDLTGDAGYNAAGVTADLADRDYTRRFGGTSAATPMVAGVVAQMLEARPDLTWRDVQAILALTARSAGIAANWSVNGAGIATSRDVGFGLVDADAAVARARSWTLLAPERRLVAEAAPALAIPDGAAPAFPSPGPAVAIDMTLAGDVTVERVVLTVDATHPWRGDVRVWVTSPSNTTSLLLPGRPNDGGDDLRAWSASSTQFFGESAGGTWRVSIEDVYATDTGTLDALKLEVFGHPRDAVPPSVTDATVNGTDVEVRFSEPVVGTGEFELTRDGIPLAIEDVTLLGETLVARLNESVPHRARATLAYRGGIADLSENALLPFERELRNLAPDVEPPAIVAALARDRELRLWLDEPVGGNATASDFTLTVGGETVSPTSLALSGEVVVLGIPALAAGQLVALAYQPADGGIVDASGNALAPFVALAVNNTTPPRLLAATVNATGLELAYDAPVELAGTGEVRVLADGAVVDVVGARAEEGTVNLTLRRAVGAEEEVRVSMERPLVRAVAGAASAEAFADVRARNLGPDLTPPRLDIVAPPATGLGGWHTTPIEVTVVAEDAGSGVPLVLACAGAAETPCSPGAPYEGPIPLGEGETVVRALARNGVGLENATERLLRVDTTPPTATVEAPASALPPGSFASIVFRFSEPMDRPSTEAALAGASGWARAWEDADRTLRLTHRALAPGAHDVGVGVGARDAHGVPLASAATARVTMLAPPPPPPPPPPAAPAAPALPPPPPPPAPPAPPPAPSPAPAPPTVTLQEAPPPGWSQEAPEIVLVAAGEPAEVLVAWDDGPESIYTAPLRAPPGEHVLHYRVVGGDAASATFRVDLEDPELRLQAPSLATRGDAVRARVLATDATSGVAWVAVRLLSPDGVEQPLRLAPDGTFEITLDRAGVHGLLASAKDIAGRAVEAHATIEVVDPPAPPTPRAPEAPVRGEAPPPQDGLVVPIPLDPEAVPGPAAGDGAPPPAPPEDARPVPAGAVALLILACALLAWLRGRR